MFGAGEADEALIAVDYAADSAAVAASEDAGANASAESAIGEDVEGGAQAAESENARGGGYSQQDLDAVKQHLGDHTEDGLTYGPNAEMLDRIQSNLANGQELSEGQSTFMQHELTESAKMEEGLSQIEAHQAALQTHPFGQNFDPDVLQMRDEGGSRFFGPAYDDAW